MVVTVCQIHNIGRPFTFQTLAGSGEVGARQPADAELRRLPDTAVCVVHQARRAGRSLQTQFTHCPQFLGEITSIDQQLPILKDLHHVAKQASICRIVSSHIPYPERRLLQQCLASVIQVLRGSAGSGS